MDPKKAADLAGRLKKAGPKGIGAGLGVLALAGGIYGATQSIYTGACIHNSQLHLNFTRYYNFVYINLIIRCYITQN